MAVEELTKTFTMEAPDSFEAAAPTIDRTPTLSILSGTRMGFVHTLRREAIVLGRSPECDVMLDDDGISRRHATITLKRGYAEIEDLQSTNGVYVDGERIRSKARLSDGARVRIGTLMLRFAYQDDDALRAQQHMYDMSTRDGLTGLYNRRYFDERLESEYAFAARHRTALAILLCDLDHFKKINDEHGHQAGDAVLRAVAGELRERVRTEDVVARFGGEELVVIARGVDVAGIRMFAERLRKIVGAMRIEFEGKVIPVSVSIGIAHTQAGPPVAKGAGLVAAADLALYAAKRAGRNRSFLAESPGRYSVHEPSPEVVVPDAPKRPPRERANTAPMMPAVDPATAFKSVSQQRIRRLT